MKKSVVILGLIFTQLALANWKDDSRATLDEYAYACDNSEIIIDSIQKNDYIKGHVKGLPTDALDKFKMVFYVKTNHWYVHPYTYYVGQEPGYSYSNLDTRGKFKVRTVMRDVPAQAMAVVLVPQDYKIKSQRFWLHPLFGFIGGILKFSCNYLIVPGTGDFKN